MLEGHRVDVGDAIATQTPVDENVKWRFWNLCIYVLTYVIYATAPHYDIVIGTLPFLWSYIADETGGMRR